jgi:hypothetical protein
VVVEVKKSLTRLGERAQSGFVNAYYLGFIGLYRAQAFISREDKRDAFEDATARSKDGRIVYFAAEGGQVRRYHPGLQGLLSDLRKQQTGINEIDRFAAERTVAAREKVLEHLHHSHD